MIALILSTQTALRVTSVEYLQNLPILVGLMLAIHAPDWGARLLLIALGSAGSAVTIALTEKIKLREYVSKKPTPLLVNLLTFFAGSAIYLGYNRLIRDGIESGWLADLVLGLVLGLVMGLAQGYGRGQGRLDTSDLMHVAGLMGAGAAICVIIGLVAEYWPPFIAAVALCIPMTLIIVRLDYWPLITTGSMPEEA
jgi:hypothetical protein